MKLKIAVIKGDGVGSEMMAGAVLVLKAVCSRYGHQLLLENIMAAGEAIELWGNPLPDQSLAACQKAGAVLFGNTGLKKYQHLPLEGRPEYALMKLRKALKVTTNIRPVCLYQSLQELSPLKERVVKRGIDMVFVRDIIGGVFCSDKVVKQGVDGLEAYEFEYYNEKMIDATARIAFTLAQKRKHKVVSLDKSNVLESSRLWRKTVSGLTHEYPEIALTHSYIDSAAMDLIAKPEFFDVIVTSNLFGDIISDEGTQLTGTPCLYGSAELAGDGRGIYTPNQLHYPDETIIGQRIINPIGMIASVALMLRYSFGLEAEAATVEMAVSQVLTDGYATRDVMQPGRRLLDTDDMAEKIAEYINNSI